MRVAMYLLTLVVCCFGLALAQHQHPLSGINLHETQVCLDGGASIHAFPRIFTGDQGVAFVQVSFRNSNATGNEWIGVFSPGNISYGDCLDDEDFAVLPPKLCTPPIKYKLISYIDGRGNETFRLVNQRADFAFGLFKGGFLNPVLIAVSETVRFMNPRAPLFPRLAQGHEWNEMTVTWTSGYAGCDAQPFVLWGKHKSEETWTAPALTQTFIREDMCGAPARTVGWRDPGYIHTSTLKDLLPRTKYFYKAGHQLKNGQIVFGKENFFVSAPAPGQDSLQRVVVLGDLGKKDRDGSDMYNAISPGALWTTDSLLRDLDNYDMVFHNGDIVYSNGYLSEWDMFIEQVSGISGRVPYMLTSGNHERDWPNSGSFYTGLDSGGECGVPIQTMYNMPLKNPSKYWYKVDFGMFRFCVADSELDWREGSEQYKFLEECFASVDRRRQPWLVFLAHRPLAYSTGGSLFTSYGEPMARENLQKLWQKYKVDLGMYGHVHSYERTCPIYEFSCVSREEKFYSGTFNATIHVTTGNGGANLVGFMANPPGWSLVRDLQYGYTKLTAFNHTTLQLEYVRSKTDEVFDSFIISRNHRNILGCDSLGNCPDRTFH